MALGAGDNKSYAIYTGKAIDLLPQNQFQCSDMGSTPQSEEILECYAKGTKMQLYVYYPKGKEFEAKSKAYLHACNGVEYPDAWKKGTIIENTCQTDKYNAVKSAIKKGAPIDPGSFAQVLQSIDKSTLVYTQAANVYLQIYTDGDAQAVKNMITAKIPLKPTASLTPKGKK